MADGDPQYQINEQLRGIRFFNGTPIIGVSASLSIESNLSSSSYIIKNAVPNSQSIDLSLTPFIREIISVSSIISIDSDTTVVSVEILKLLSYMSASTDVTVSASRIPGIIMSISIPASVNVTAQQFFYTQPAISVTSGLTFGPKKVSIANAQLSQLLSFSINEFTIFNGLSFSPFLIQSNVLIADAIRFTPNARTPGSLVTLLLLDNQPLTDQNRKFSDSVKPVFIENKNWNNTKSRYYKRSNGGKTSFKISWEWLPSDRDSTVDKRFARDFISSKAMDPDIHTLTVLTYGENPEDVFEKTDYNVFISSYSEDLIRRDLSSEVYLWNCSLDLEEV